MSIQIGILTDPERWLSGRKRRIANPQQTARFCLHVLSYNTKNNPLKSHAGE
jgi:hypothetical protein